MYKFMIMDLYKLAELISNQYDTILSCLSAVENWTRRTLLLNII